ncbi:hypothetical protein [Paraburkholderia bonniea]|uniref:hypothetical protein n=1 Tax=Paraburkholderia bonniea TaxID=2152891 RepID=UPI001290B920|nr:hypothetical protein [Paraburkholderia bonniea]
MEINSSMKKLLLGNEPDDLLSSSLKKIANSGFKFESDCYFLCELVHNAKNVRKENFPDNTGYECFVNSIHIDDYVDENLLKQAILFVIEIFSSWNKLISDIALVAIVCVDELSVTVKFHVHRSNEIWLNPNIDSYEDPIFSVKSLENVATELSKFH